MKCSTCECDFEAIEYNFIGQAMCPACGEIVDIADEAIYEGDSDEENPNDVY